MSTPRLFLSVANREHDTFRAQLRNTLTRTQFFDCIVQPDFPHSAADTVQKLDGLIASCDLLIHIVGTDHGSRANADAVDDFFASAEGPTRDSFLANLPKARALLGDFSQLTYFQWEPWLALHRGKDLLVYAIPGHEAAEFPQRAHLDALRSGRHHAESLWAEQIRVAQIVGDVCAHFGILPDAPKQKIAPSRLVSRHTTSTFLGREQELALLDAAWAGAQVDTTTDTGAPSPANVNLLSLIAWGGVGKTALLAEWVDRRFRQRGWKDAAGQPEPVVYFDWTFYDQGTRADDATHAGAASVGTFFVEALRHFGDPEPDEPKGKVTRLAERIQQHKNLLVLDGLEPLQYPPNHPQAGQITDPDLRELLATLAQANPGLCVVTSRQHLSDLSGLAHSSAPSRELDQLPDEVAIRLLRQLQITGSEEDLASAARDYQGHALSLILLGRYLFVAKGGDIRRRDTIKFERANEQRSAQTRNAWHVLEAYEQWLASPKGRPEDLQALRLLGLFDRPASADCLAALRRAPAIPGLTDRLVVLADDEWNAVLHRLHEAHLIALRFPEAGADATAPRPEPRDVPVDAHPLIREYFGQQLRKQVAPMKWWQVRQPIPGAAFRTAHARLFDHLCESTPHRPDTLDGLQPLYQAVVHGCFAGRQEEACGKVYIDRILRGTGHDGNYSTKKLGATGADLGAVAAFFEPPWTRLSPNLSAAVQAWLLNEAAFNLRALGRLTEALEPMRVAVEMRIKAENWKQAAISYSNLSELEVTLGQLGPAVADARRAIDFADRSGDAFQRVVNRTTAADALHHSGQPGEQAEARALLAAAEALQLKYQPQFPLLYSLRGFHYCDLLLASAERTAWRAQGGEVVPPPLAAATAASHSALAEGEGRATETLAWVTPQNWLLDIALDHLTLARVTLYRAALAPQPPAAGANPHLAPALDGLRKAGQADELPKALLTAAHWHALLGDPDTAERHLAEAQQIAERGPMPLYLADVHLHRARLFRDKEELTKAKALIEQHAYGRRCEELADAEAAAASW